MEVKEAKDLLNLKWRRLTKEELHDIRCRVVGDMFPRIYSSKSHIKDFLREVTNNISREFEIPADDITEILIQKNEETLYKLKHGIFRKGNSIRSINEEMSVLFSLFTVPERSEVDKVLLAYKKLSPEQKKEFKRKILWEELLTK